jgi:hypothetical protein
MSKKLLEDPAISALVEKREAAAVANATKQHRAALRSIKASIKTQVDVHAKDAGDASNPDAKRRIKTLGADILAQVTA